jgi:nucleoside phosphorylase
VLANRPPKKKNPVDTRTFVAEVDLYANYPLQLRQLSAEISVSVDSPLPYTFFCTIFFKIWGAFLRVIASRDRKSWSAKQPRILLASAWLPEQLWLQERMEEMAESLGLAVGKDLLPPVDFLLTGVGSLRAAAAVAKVLEHAKEPAHSIQSGESEDWSQLYSHVVFVGTAGAYDLSRFPLHSVVITDSVWFTDAGAIAKKSYFPSQSSQSAEYWHGDFFPELKKKVFAEEAELKKLHLARVNRYSISESVPRVNCVCVPSISADAALSKKLAVLGEVENLELAGVAAACALHAVPWCAVLGIANEVGPEGHAQWTAENAKASIVAQEYVWSFLR